MMPAKNSKPREEKPEKPSRKGDKEQVRYCFDPDTGQWTVRNPSGSVAYNVLSRDEWGWLD